MSWGLRCGALFLLLITLGACATERADRPAQYRRVAFESLPGWTADDPAPALAAFLRSCDQIGRLADARTLGPYGTAADWRDPCASARNLTAVGAPGAQEARAFFEASFVPFAVQSGRNRDGLFTGYYEPALRGSRSRSVAFAVPLLARPADLVGIDLGAFRDSLRGQRLAGRVEGGKLVPYADRATLEAEALGPPSPLRQPIVWVDSAADAFFLHIQGSGRVMLDDGSVIRVNYDGQNGHPYTAIGRVLIERGVLERGKAGMQAIRDWLAAHPAEAKALLDENASYVFFRERPVGDPALGPEGAGGVALTPGRSLAVDRKFHGLGVPMWVAAEAPQPGDPPVQRLMIAQDTGGAIVGPVRGDVFWGFGDEAGAVAGAMQSTGRLTVLLPKAIADRFAAAHRR